MAVDKQGQLHFKSTLKKAKEAKQLYLRGYTTEEIAKTVHASIRSIRGYYMLTGGISLVDKAKHYKYRYLKKGSKIIPAQFPQTTKESHQ